VSQRRQLHDRFFRLAKQEGYLARSAYKLKQLAERHRLLRRGDRVLDLGCAPGSWLQVASELVAPDGIVVGLDLQEVAAPMPANVRALVADVFAVAPRDLLQLLPAGARFDVVLSDMAPSTSGGAGGSSDHFRSVELCRRVLALLPGVLAPGGRLAMKVFEGEQYPALLRETGRFFATARGYKPAATREVSREMYVVAHGYQRPGGAAPHEQTDAAPAPPRPRAGWSRPDAGP